VRLRASSTIAVLVSLCAVVWAQSFYRVDRVIDGDTVVVAGIGTVRLIGVDTPETVDPRKPVELFGKEASVFLTGLLAGKTVRLEYDQTLKDKYNRTLAYLYLSDGTFVNREIVRQGYGHAYTEFPFRHMNDFRAAEQEARSNNRGLWGTGTTPPAAAATSPSSVSAGNENETVYVTRTGEKYHRDGCRSLARSKIATTLKEASGRYGACSICKPPILAVVTNHAPSTPTVTSPPPTPPDRTAPASRRCAAITKAGTQCSRNASAGSSYCWQHGR
jgi:micrococcal nuclease